jgi:ATP-dependent exoDNAse (exonuclease V) beta subunit
VHCAVERRRQFGRVFTRSP